MGFMEKGLNKGAEKSGYSSVTPKLTTRLYVPVGVKTELILLDDADDAAVIYEHGMFIQGDKNSSKIKLTCRSPGDDPVPQQCRGCEAMIRDDRVYRQSISFLSCISLDTFVYENVKYTHLKKLVPLNSKMTKILLERKKDYGSLVGARFIVYRSDQQSSRVGNDWQFKDRVNLLKFFQNSPRLIQLVKSAKKAGEDLSPALALKRLITPFDYGKILEPTPKTTEYFLGYLGLNNQAKGQQSESVSTNYSEPGTEDADGGIGEVEEDFSEFNPPETPKKKGK